MKTSDSQLSLDVTLQALRDFVCQGNRVCPQPSRWNELWQMLPEKKELDAGGWKPALPPILGAWWDTPASTKRMRLFEHLYYAAEHGGLGTVDRFLRALPEEEWAHLGDF